jgi:predicted DNA-binding protein (MmcQ/YjbR family)
MEDKLDHKTVEDYIMSMPGAVREFPFGPDVAVYKAATEAEADESKMYALIAEGSNPLRLSLKCDPQLSVLLREKYETVMAGYHLNKKHWNTIVLTGQVPWEELQDLIRHSYLLVTGYSELPEYVSKRPGRAKKK